MEKKINSLIILIIFNFIFGKNKYISFIIVVNEYSDYFCNVNIGVFCKFGLVIDKVIFYF